MGQAFISKQAGEKLELPNGKAVEILEVSPLSADVLIWLNTETV